MLKDTTNYTIDVDAIRNDITTYIGYINKGLLGTDTSLREHMWIIFAALLGKHIKEYTIPQYGDYPNDNMSSFSAEDCEKNISRYVARFGTNARGVNETLRDYMKIAHYAAMAFIKANGFEDLFKDVKIPTLEDLSDLFIEEGQTPSTEAEDTGAPASDDTAGEASDSSADNS